MKAIFKVLTLLALILSQVEAKGKTYDDLDDILKIQGDSKLSERSNHHAYVKPEEPGKVDKSKVVHIVRESKSSIATTGIALSKPQFGQVNSNETKVYRRVANKDKIVQQKNLTTSWSLDEKMLNTLAFKLLKTPKRDNKNEQLYFFLISLLILATAIIIVSSCGCLIFFLIKTMIAKSSSDDQQRGGRESHASNDTGRRQDRFQQFHDEEQPNNHDEQPYRDSDAGAARDQQLDSSRLRRLNYRDAVEPQIDPDAAAAASQEDK